MCSGAHGNDPPAWPLESIIDFRRSISQHINNEQTCSIGVLAEEEQAGGFKCSLGGGDQGHAFHFRYEMEILTMQKPGRPANHANHAKRVAGRVIENRLPWDFFSRYE